MLVTSGLMAAIDVPAEAWRVSPWNPIAYSVLVLVLGYIAIKRDRRADEQDKEMRELNERHRQQTEKFIKDFLEPRQEDER